MLSVQPAEFKTPRKYRLLIDGKWVDAASGKSFTSPNPSTGEVFAEVAAADNVAANTGRRRVGQETMSKARAAGVLGSLMLCGLLFLSSLAVAGGDNYFAKLKGTFLRACSKQASELQTDIGAHAFREACSFVVRVLENLPSNPNPEETETQEAFLDALKNTGETCDQCVAAVGDLQTSLAANNTAQDIEDALAAGCEKRFSDTAEADQCRQNVDAVNVPLMVNFFTSDLPPLVACRELTLCPPLP